MDGILIIDLVETVMCSGKGRYHITIANDGSMSIWPDSQMAKWVKEHDRDNHWHCSACGSVWGTSHKVMQFCPNCGAEMIEEVDDDYDS